MTLDSFDREMKGNATRHRVAVQVRDYVERHFRTGIGLRDVARELGYSPAHLTYVYRRETGQPVLAWIIERRLLEACRLLENGDAAIASVAEHVGFRDVTNFSRRFQRFTGMTPGRWRYREREPHAKTPDLR